MRISKKDYKVLQGRVRYLEEVVRSLREDVSCTDRLLVELGYVCIDYSTTPKRWVKEESK